MTQPTQSTTVNPNNAVRVSKRAARRLYALGMPMIMVPCNEWPFSRMASSFPMHKSDNDEAVTTPPNTMFDNRVNAFTFYNCTYETGYYAAFYVNEHDALAHNVTPLNLERN